MSLKIKKKIIINALNKIEALIVINLNAGLSPVVQSNNIKSLRDIKLTSELDRSLSLMQPNVMTIIQDLCSHHNPDAVCGSNGLVHSDCNKCSIANLINLFEEVSENA